MAEHRKKYVLESEEENERLDRQSRMKAHDFKPELRFLQISDGQKILDAGCGSGIVTDYLSHAANNVKVSGWDFSASRIESAQKRYGSASNIQFMQKDLLHFDPKVEMDRFDIIVCRYVVHHFNSFDSKKVIQNLVSLLKPGGIFYCINVDGLFGDIFPASPFLSRCLSKIRTAQNLDFLASRKVPSILADAGLQNVDWQIHVSEFKGEERTQEIENLRQSVRNAEAFFVERLGGKAAFNRFEREYFLTLEAATSVHFYNKIISMGSLPRPTLVRV